MGMNFVFVFEMSVSLMAWSNIIALLKICSPHGSKSKNYEFLESGNYEKSFINQNHVPLVSHTWLLKLFKDRPLPLQCLFVYFYSNLLFCLSSVHG